MKRILLAAASVFVLLTGNAGEAMADCAAAPLASTSDMVVSFLAANGTQAAPGTALASTVKEGMLIYDNTADALKICNGTTWQTLSVGGGGVTAAGTVAGAVQFRSSGGNLAADDTNFVWDDTNDRLGIGTATPTVPLEVNGEALISPARIREQSGWAAFMHKDVLTNGTSYAIMQSSTGITMINAAAGQSVAFRIGGGATQPLKVTAGGVVISDVTTTTPHSSAALDITATTKGFLPPRMTTTEVGNIATPADGLIVYDTDTDTIKLRANGAWISLLGGSGSETDPQVGTLTATKWCAANAGGTAIDCTADAPATGAAGAASEVQFRNSGTGAFAANANFVWDNTNTRLGIGTASPGFAPAAGRSYVTVAGPTNAGVLEFLTNQADADGNGVGLIQFSDKNTTATTEKRVAAIMGALDGTTANLRGGSLRFFTRPDNSDTALAERMRISANGNVGIGTSSPAGPLHVATATATPAITMERSGDANVFIEFKSTTGLTGVDGGGSSGRLRFYTAGSERARIDSSGNIGIGTTSPQAVTHISSTNGQLFRLQNTGASGGTWDLKVGGGGWSDGQFHIAERTGALDAARMVILPGGNVGIGTATPRGLLDVNGAVRLKAGAPVNDSAAFGLAFEDNGDTGLFMTNYSSSATGDLNLYANATARMTVIGSGTNVGFVGIGTTAPASLLHVAGGVQLGNDAASCVAAKYGTLRYASDSLELCGTSGWVSLVSGALVTGTGAAGTSAAAVTNAGWQNFPGSPTLVFPSAGTYFVTSQVYYTYGAGCGDVLMNWSGSNILYKSTDSKWQGCGASGTTNWSTYSHVITLSAGATLNAQYNWTNGGTSGTLQFGGGKFIKLNTGGGGGGGGGGGTPGGADTQVQFNSSGAFAGSTDLVWDNTNSRLGISTASPDARLSIRSGGISVGGAFPSDIWSQTSMVAIGNSATGAAAQGLIGHQGSHELDIFWNFYRKTDSSYTGLGANGYTSANGIRMGNLGIYFVGTSAIGTTMPATNMTLLNTGNLGIGTTTPAQKLDVAGTATANGVILKPAAGAAAPSAGTQVWESDGTHAWRATGNVGVGTASPSYKLHVSGDGYITTSLGVGVAPSATIGTYVLKTGTNSDGHGMYGYGNKVTTASGTYYSAGTYSVARSTVSSGVTDSGWIIGSHISGLRAAAGDLGTLANVYGSYHQFGHVTGVGSTATTTNAYGVLVQPYQQAGTITNSYSLYLASPTTGGTVTNNFGLYQASTAQKNYLAGNVGIGSGTTSPAYTLDVTGTARATGNYYTNGSLYMGQDGTSTILYGSSAANQYMSLYGAASNVTGASIVLYGRTYSTTEGRVSYFANTNTNDTTPSHAFYKISSGGTATSLMSVRSNGNTYVYGDYTCSIGIATTVSCSSDRRLKTDIEPITGGLDSVLKLRPVTFKLKNPEKSQRQRMGFIAQEVQEIFPQAIDKDDQTDYLTMDYAMLVAPLVDAVKELNTKRLDLEAKVAAQGAEIETLKTQNADILKRLEALEATATKQ